MNFDQTNPYASAVPVSPDPTDRDSHSRAWRMFTPAAVCWATLCGSMLAGGVVLAINYARLGRSSAAIQTVAWTGLGTIAIIGVGMALPESNAINFALIAAQAWLMYVAAVRLQIDDLRRHCSNGGQIASNWAGIGIGLTVGIVVAAILLAGIAVYDSFVTGTAMK